MEDNLCFCGDCLASLGHTPETKSFTWNDKKIYLQNANETHYRGLNRKCVICKTKLERDRKCYYSEDDVKYLCTGCHERCIDEDAYYGSMLFNIKIIADLNDGQCMGCEATGRFVILIRPEDLQKAVRHLAH
jgi:hypothetical protein